MRIGEVASAIDCPLDTIRYYEKEGLLPPPKRSTGNYRVYGPEHVERLAFIRRCRSLDMSLPEIRTLPCTILVTPSRPAISRIDSFPTDFEPLYFIEEVLEITRTRRSAD